MTWPVTNVTFGTYQWLALGVQDYLDLGADDAALNEEQQKRVDWIVQQGVWQFYNPPLIEGQTAPHCWTFQKIYATLSLTSNDWDIDLPSGYGGGFSDPSYEIGDAARRLEIVDEYTIRSLHSKNDQAGTPFYVAVRPKAVVLTAEQAFEALFYPKPDGSYTVGYRYKQNHAALTTTNLYPLGTRTHAMTLLQSCLACAELSRNKQPGPMYEKFLRDLTSSIQQDRAAEPSDNVVEKKPGLARQEPYS